MRRILAIIFGVAAATLILAGVDWLDGVLYPVSQELGDLESADPAALAALVASVPLPAKVIAAFGWLLAAFGGAWLALRVCDRQWTGWTVVAVVIAAGVYNLFTLPYPFWMQACTVLMPMCGGALAVRWHRKPYPGEALLG